MNIAQNVFTGLSVVLLSLGCSLRPPDCEDPVEPAPETEAPVEEAPVEESPAPTPAPEPPGCTDDCQPEEGPTSPEPEPQPEPEGYCGNGVCEAGDGETYLTCGDDCPEPQPEPAPEPEPQPQPEPTPDVCGDKICSAHEYEEWTCPEDCREPEKCGDGVCEEGEDCDTCPADCGETSPEPAPEPQPEPQPQPEPVPAPAPANVDVVKLSSDGRTLLLSKLYVGGDDCVELLGGLPGIDWVNGDVACNNSSTVNAGYIGYEPGQATATLATFSYRANAVLDADGNEMWADYGESWQRHYLAQMSVDALAYVYCPFWNAETQTNNGSSASCSLMVTFDDDGLVSAAGNMANWNRVY